MPTKRADGRYELKVRISKPGEPRKYKAVYGTTLREARQKAEEIKSTLNQTNCVHKYTVADAIDYWLEQKDKTVRPQTLANYATALRFPKAQLGDRRLADITVDDARQLHEQVAQHSIVQANRMVSRMGQVYKDAIVRGITAKNPWGYVAPAKHNKADKRALTKQELEAISAAELLPWERAFITVLRYTGMRRGEALALDVSDMDFNRKTISISKTDLDGAIGPAKTKSSVRTIPMPDALIECLREYREQYHPGEGLLFPNTLGRPMSNSSFRAIWIRIANAVYRGNPPADFTPHIFRHTYASELVRNKVPPTTAMLLLGHRSLSTTMEVYTHLGWQDIDAEQINNIFCGG